MYRILITQHINDLAESMREQLTKYTINPIQKLEGLISDLSNDTQRQYVQHIIDNWDKLIVAKLDDITGFINSFEDIIPTEQIKNETITLGGKDYLDKAIVDAMMYNKVQDKIYPSFMQELGIKACVYCNAQYAFASPHGSYRNYELDHLYPKDKYPYLCTSFFNLQPCCSHCNKTKKDKTSSSAFNLFTMQPCEQNPMQLTLESSSIVKYIVSLNPSVLKIKFDSSDTALKTCHEDMFKISKLYEGHTDVAEELIWKKLAYNPTYISAYRLIFKALRLSQTDVERFILGNYSREEDIHKRPLSKMTQDIAKQLKII